MNRKIEFRVWNKHQKYFIYSRISDQSHYMISLDGNFYNLHNNSGGDDYVIQQYTGIKDNTGNKIFEGDIVNYYGTNFTVKWDEYRWVLESSSNDRPNKIIINLTALGALSCHVIKNIFENN